MRPLLGGSTIRKLRAYFPFLALLLAAIGVTLALPAAASANAPAAASNGVGTTGATTAVLLGEIDPGNLQTTYEVDYDLASSPWCTSQDATGSSAYSTTPAQLPFSDATFHSVSVDLSGLTSDVDYCAKLVVTNTDGVSDSALQTWAQGSPEVDTTGAAATDLTTASLDGQIDPHHQSVTYDMEYAPADSAWCTSSGASGTPERTSGTESLGFADNTFHDVTVEVDGLTLGAAYCGALATTSGYDERVVGQQVTWTQSLPDADTWDAYSTSATATTVEGDVNPAGDSTTTYQVQYDTADSGWCTSGGATGTPAYTTTASSSGLDLTSTNYQDVLPTVSELIAGQDYCGQIVATNDTGEADGGQVFWTQGAPTTDTFDASATTYSTATVDGDVDPAGTSTTYMVRYDLATSSWCQSYGLSGTAAHTSSATPLSSTNGSFDDVTVGLSGLAADTDYCGEVVAANSHGEGDSLPVFWTQPTAPPPPATLKVQVFGSGTVTSSPAGIHCPSTCSHTFPNGTQVTLTATAAPGATFGGWHIFGCETAAPTCTISLVGEAIVWADFSMPPPPALGSVEVTQLGGPGTITSSPAGIHCTFDGTIITVGSVCDAHFPLGTRVTLTATADADLASTFDGWSSAGCSGTGTCTVSATYADTNVEADYTQGPPPRCKLKANPKVPLRGAGAGKLTVSLTCNQEVDYTIDAAFTLTWKTTVRRKAAHGRKAVRKAVTHRKNWTLAELDGHAARDAAFFTTVTMPKAALAKLRLHKSLSAELSVTVTNINGANGTTLSLKHLS